MSNSIKKISELTKDYIQAVGTEAYFLCKSRELQIPILDGYVVSCDEFESIDNLFNSVNNFVTNFSSVGENYNLSVRPSIAFKDTSRAFFNGKIQNAFNLTEADDVIDTILAMINSGNNEVVERYCVKHEIAFPLQISAIVQSSVPAEISGKIYTAMPESGSHLEMQGYFINDTIDMLDTAEELNVFSICRPDGLYKGATILQPYAKKLYDYSSKLHDTLNVPLEIEWVIFDNKLQLTRITPFGALNPYRLDTYEVNESVDGDFLWSNFSIKEYLPDVLTPMTWSVLRKLDTSCEDYPKYYKWSGNILGRAYSNINVPFSASHYIEPRAKGYDISDIDKEVYGNIPIDIDLPIYPFKRLTLVQHLTKKKYTLLSHALNRKSKTNYFIENTNKWRTEMLEMLNYSDMSNWEKAWEQITSYVSEIWMLWHEYSDDKMVSSFRSKLVSIAGEENANFLMSAFSDSSPLESLAPLIGLEKLYDQKISRNEFKELYGHRSPYELELSMPYPYEDNDFITRQLIEFENADMNVSSMLEETHLAYQDKINEFCMVYPKHKGWLLRNLDKINEICQEKDAIYSELVRCFSITRMALLRLGELLEIYSDIFYLYEWELIPLVHNPEYMIDYCIENIAKRKITFEYYKSLDPMPYLIRGEYNPNDPTDILLDSINKENPYFDNDSISLVKTTRAQRTLDTTEITDKVRKIEESNKNGEKNPFKNQLQLTGIGGFPDVVEGVVRIVENFEELYMLKPGEILVTSAINTGWSYQLPKAAAIITDIGTSLSSGAIIARELGIPAIVGCISATKQLKTGDRVVVDGGKGYITKVDSKSRSVKFNIEEISEYLA